MFARKSTVVFAAVLAVALGFAATALLPGSQTPIGLLASAFASSGPAYAGSGVETVEGEVSGYKYSPSGSHVDGFYLDGNGLLPGRTAVAVPPHAASHMPREGSSVRVGGIPHTTPHGEEVFHAMNITDNETGRTFEFSAEAGAVPPHGVPNGVPNGGSGFAAPPVPGG